jgi:hypothetical protein
MEITMKNTLSFVLLCLFMFAAGCSTGLKSQVLGKWEPQQEGLKGTGVLTEITANEIKTGRPTGSLSLTSPYRFVDGETIEAETTLLGKTIKNRYKVAITGDEMTWTDEKGSARKFKRTK